MLYHAYEMAHAALTPLRLAAIKSQEALANPLNPWAYTGLGKAMRASLDLFEGATRRYSKPEWGIDKISIHAMPVPIHIETALALPFCRLLHFRRELGEMERARERDPKVMIVAPLSGHYATLLRGTIRAMLQEHDVYVT